MITAPVGVPLSAALLPTETVFAAIGEDALLAALAIVVSVAAACVTRGLRVRTAAPKWRVLHGAPRTRARRAA